MPSIIKNCRLASKNNLYLYEKNIKDFGNNSFDNESDESNSIDNENEEFDSELQEQSRSQEIPENNRLVSMQRQGTSLKEKPQKGDNLIGVDSGSNHNTCNRTIGSVKKSLADIPLRRSFRDELDVNEDIDTWAIPSIRTRTRQPIKRVVSTALEIDDTAQEVEARIKVELQKRRTKNEVILKIFYTAQKIV